MLLTEKEQIDEPHHSNFGAVKLLGSGGGIKSVCVSQEQKKKKSPTPHQHPLAFALDSFYCQ